MCEIKCDLCKELNRMEQSVFYIYDDLSCFICVKCHKLGYSMTFVRYYVLMARELNDFKQRIDNLLLKYRQ